MCSAERFGSYLKTLTAQIDMLQGDKQKFADKFLENPSYAIKWMDQTVYAMARLEVMQRYSRIFHSPEFSLDQLTAIRDRLAEEVLQRAGNRERSTSASSNLLERELTGAYADLLNELNSVIGYQ